MDISELIDEILERVDGDVVSSDPYTDRRILHSDLWNLVEKYDAEKNEETSDQINTNLEAKIEELEAELSDLKEDYYSLERENEILHDRIRELEAEDD